MHTQIWYALSSSKVILALIMLRSLENKVVSLIFNKLVQGVTHPFYPLSCAQKRYWKK